MDDNYETHLVKMGICPDCGADYGLEVLSSTGEPINEYSHCECRDCVEQEYANAIPIAG